MIVSIHDLSFTYPDGTSALRGVNLRVEQGEKVAILGQNGSGKTTLAKLLNGLLVPSDGNVTVGELNTRAIPLHQLSRTVGYVFQNPDDQLFSQTVADEIEFGPKNLKFTPEKVAEARDRALALTGMMDLRDVHPYELSLAKRKFIAIASVIAMDPAVIILDEPTSSQDPRGIQRLREIIAELSKLGKTVITITHDLDFAAETFNRVIILRDGVIAADGPAAEILTNMEVLRANDLVAPQLTRLAKALDPSSAVSKMDEFLKRFGE